MVVSPVATSWLKDFPGRMARKPLRQRRSGIVLRKKWFISVSGIKYS
jgi:hypothetical protein